MPPEYGNMNAIVDIYSHKLYTRAHTASPKVPALSKRRQRPLRRLQRATSNATLCPQRWRLSAVAFFQVLKKSGPKCGEARLRRLSLMKRAEVTGAHSREIGYPGRGGG